NSLNNTVGKLILRLDSISGKRGYDCPSVPFNEKIASPEVAVNMNCSFVSIVTLVVGSFRTISLKILAVTTILPVSSISKPKESSCTDKKLSIDISASEPIKVIPSFVAVIFIPVKIGIVAFEGIARDTSINCAVNAALPIVNFISSLLIYILYINK